jgi:hypothetical protein
MATPAIFTINSFSLYIQIDIQRNNGDISKQNHKMKLKF